MSYRIVDVGHNERRIQIELDADEAENISDALAPEDEGGQELYRAAAELRRLDGEEEEWTDEKERLEIALRGGN